MATLRARQRALRARGPRQWNRVVAHRGWLAARDRVLTYLGERPAIVVVEGDPGTGKTFLLNELGRVLRSGKIAAQILPGDLSIPAWDSIDLKSVLLIDDAGRLEDGMLASLVEDTSRLLVLADRPGFAGRLDGLAAHPRLLALEPLPADEVWGFLAASLAQSGTSVDVFDPASLARLATCSAGVPRVLHDLAGTAMFLADREHASRVEPRHVEQAASVVDLGLAAQPLISPLRNLVAIAPPDAPDAPDPPRTAKRRRWAALGVVAGAAAACALAVVASREPASSPAPRPATPEATASLPEAPAALPPLASLPDPPLLASPALPPIAVSPPALSRVAASGDGPTLTALPDTSEENTSLGAAPDAAKFRHPASPRARPPERQAAAAEPAAPAVAPPAGLPAGLPTGAMTSVSIHFPPGNLRAEQAARELASGLREDGFEVDGPVPAAARKSTGISYVFHEDRGAAVSVAAAAHRHLSNLPLPPVRHRPPRGAPVHPGDIDIMVSRGASS